jgi:hypothetical protein
VTITTFADPKRESAYVTAIERIHYCVMQGWLTADEAALLRHRTFVAFTENAEIPR